MLLSRPRRVILLIVLLSAAAALVYLLMLLGTIPQLMRLTGGLPIPDLTHSGYDMQHLGEVFERLGPEGRELYLGRQLPLDMLYPGLFAAACGMAIHRLAGVAGVGLLQRRVLTALPIITGACDYFENVCIAVMLLRYPESPGAWATLSSVATVCKSVLLLCAVAALCVVAVLALVRSRRAGLSRAVRTGGL
jgi:hypothetical protein